MIWLGKVQIREILRLQEQMEGIKIITH